MYKIILLLLLIFIIWRLISKKENFSVKKIKIHIINLDKDKDRLDTLDNQMAKYSLDYERYNAINGKKYYLYKDLDIKYISPKFKKKYNNFHKACLLSHVDLWDKIKDDKQLNLIIEDDAIIPVNLGLKINSIMEQLPDDWGFLFLGGNKIYGTKFSRNLIQPKVNSNGNFGMFAYIVNPTKIKEILSKCKNIKVTIDWFIQSELSKFFKIFFANPQIISHDYNNISNLIGINRKHDEISNNKITIL